jgi:general secretion pathway protein A
VNTNETRSETSIGAGPEAVPAKRAARRAPALSFHPVYNDFYGFLESPFNLTPDPRFLFFSDKHREAFHHVLFGIRERKGFIQLTGEVGAGKTTVCRALLAELGEGYQTALILNPMVSGAELVRSILTELGLETLADGTAYLEVLNRFLLEQAEAGRDVVLLVDEAQDLTPELLEQVRLLSNLETDRRKLIQIVLIGQPELRDKLNARSLRQLRQRITVRYHLKPLDLDETERYISHRLLVAGADGRPKFSRGAVRAVHRYARGVPRLINAVCDKALLYGYVNSTYELKSRAIRQAIRELEGTS